MLKIKNTPKENNFLYAIIAVIFLFGSIHTAYPRAKTTKIYQTIADRIVENLIRQPSNDKTVSETLTNLQPNGSWPDVDYASKTITIWSPTNHLLKLKILVKAYITKKSSFYADEKVFANINNALQYWYNQDPKSAN